MCKLNLIVYEFLCRLIFQFLNVLCISEVLVLIPKVSIYAALQRALCAYMKEHDAFISSYVADSQELLTEDEKVLKLHPLRFKNTMLLTPWCQKLEHYHFKQNQQFKAKEIKIRVVLFLVLKHIKYREDWNSPTHYFMFYILYVLYNGTCYIEQISQYICYIPWVLFHSSIWDTSLLIREIRVRLLEDAIHDWECQLLLA